MLVRGSIALAWLVVGCAGGRHAPPPPDRTSPELIFLADTEVRAVDARSGVFVDRERVSRIEGDSIVTIASLPSGSDPALVRSFAGTTWLGLWSGDAATVRIEPDGTVTRFVGTDCVAAAVDVPLTLHDARSPTDVWGSTFHDVPVLCHFDGTTWSAETLPFAVDSLVATDEALFAVDRSDIPRLLRRPIGGGEWSPISEDDLGGAPSRVQPTPSVRWST